jgi:hypothetical protein
MDSLGFIVIIFVVITIVSAVSAGKKKPSKSGDQNEAAPRRPVMSDIQRAFMMMSGLESEDNAENEKKRSEVLSGFKAPPPPAGSTPGSGFGDREGLGDYEGLSYSEGFGDSEGLSDYGKAASGSLTGDSAIEKEAGIYKYAAAAEMLKGASETVTDDDAPTLTELKGLSSFERRGDMEHRLDESAELADIAEANRDRMLAGSNRAHPALGLFESKSDIVKAVIFSEVLKRRPPAGRCAAK